MLHRKTLYLAVSVLLVAAALGAGIAASASTSPKPPVTYYGCLSGGTLSKVSTTSHACGKGYAPAYWDQRGPSNSYFTSASDIHLNDTLTDVLSIKLATGSYVLDADVWLENTSPSNTSSLGVCELTLGTATDEVQVGLLGPSSAPQNDATVSLTVAATVKAPSSATVDCEAVGNSGDTYAETGSMTAVQSANLTG